MKSENHIWLQNIHNFLYSVGLGHLWENIKSIEKDSLKHIFTKHMENLFIQKYDEYVSLQSNKDKCHIANLCKSEIYKKQQYLSEIDSPQNRSIFSKLRLDVNSTLDCRSRSFRFKNTIDNKCPSCNLKGIRSFPEHHNFLAKVRVFS